MGVDGGGLGIGNVAGNGAGMVVVVVGGWFSCEACVSWRFETEAVVAELTELRG